MSPVDKWIFNWI